ncbi:unnamed protein product [Phytophthora lilii]|uniref:Unnamed protein product n=1 Tax=Phytophthora lilii TaxID=2077276 RepID=A0A9W6UAS0_9STRA|nr:unnamed protein product [Phytophthora lilii]
MLIGTKAHENAARNSSSNWEFHLKYDVVKLKLTRVMVAPGIWRTFSSESAALQPNGQPAAGFWAGKQRHLRDSAA